jgi:N-acyl-D-amino-acid deacylase
MYTFGHIGAQVRLVGGKEGGTRNRLSTIGQEAKPMSSRREWPGLSRGAGAAACLAVLLSGAACDGGEPTAPPVPPAQPEVPVTGAAVPGMASYDQAIPELMRKYAIPGGAVAVLRDGKLIYARGFGYADVESKTQVQPDALFRIASVSKPITSAAIMTLVEDGKLRLDDRVAPLIAHLAPAPGATVDPRWEQITIRHLLTTPGAGIVPSRMADSIRCSAGDRRSRGQRARAGVRRDDHPLHEGDAARLQSGREARLLELRLRHSRPRDRAVSGMPYEEYVRARVLQPVGANRTRSGRTRMRDALAGEVKYYLPGEAGLG